MIIIKQSSRIKDFIDRQKALGLITGFVPTMGALHAGHLDLLRISVSQTDMAICSIFVNPTQFNDQEDYNKYPQTLEQDIRLLERSAAAAVFLPDSVELYSSGLTGLEKYDLGHLETILEGKYRPGHFQGVCQVMSRLLKLVNPDKLFMGQKDYQQCMVVERLLELLDLDIQLVRCPTVREPDGLALSSRNLRLQPEQRAVAPVIFHTLRAAKETIVPGDLSVIRKKALAHLERNHFRPDYFEIANAATLEPVSVWDGRQRLVILVAAFLGDVRLIDNLLVN